MPKGKLLADSMQEILHSPDDGPGAASSPCMRELPKKTVRFCKWPAQRQSLLPVEELTAELCYESVTGSLLAQLQQQPDPAVLNASIKQSVRHFHMLGAIAPFAAASGGANTFLLLTKAMARFIKVSTHHKISTLLSLFLALCV